MDLTSPINTNMEFLLSLTPTFFNTYLTIPRYPAYDHSSLAHDWRCIAKL